MRSIQKKYICPTCNQNLDHVICSEFPKESFDFTNIYGDNIGPDYVFDFKSRMFFPKDYYKSKIESLWMCKCPTCSTVKRDMKSLRGHVYGEHKMQICTLCVEHKQVFPSEHKIYTQGQYETHLRRGDGDGSKGHPSCEFCRTRFYSSTELFMHLVKDHESCFLCEKAGISFKYYKDYNSLEDHFRRDHLICEDPVCIAKRFMAFSNEIDQAAHNKMWHPEMQLRQSIPTFFKVRRANSTSSSANGNSNSGSTLSGSAAAAADSGGSDVARRHQFEGGLGGRAQEGEWQVEFQPSAIAVDPRAAERNVGDVPRAPATYSSSSTSGGGAIDEDRDFPALPAPSNMAPINGGGGYSANRWVTMSGTDKSSKLDSYPALKKNIVSKAKVVSRGGKTGTVAVGGQKARSAAEMDFLHMTADMNSTNGSNVSTPAQPPVSSLGDWATIRVDKKGTTGAGSSKGGKGAPAAAPTAGAHSSNMELQQSQYDTDMQLALALSNTFSTAPSTSSTSIANGNQLNDRAYPALAGEARGATASDKRKVDNTAATQALARQRAAQFAKSMASMGLSSSSGKSRKPGQGGISVYKPPSIPTANASRNATSNLTSKPNATPQSTIASASAADSVLIPPPPAPARHSVPYSASDSEYPSLSAGLSSGKKCDDSNSKNGGSKIWVKGPGGSGGGAIPFNPRR